jgi:hypothetical protein
MDGDRLIMPFEAIEDFDTEFNHEVKNYRTVV